MELRLFIVPCGTLELMPKPKNNFEQQMQASYTGLGHPEYKEEFAESAGSLRSHYGGDNSDYPEKPYYVAGKDRGYTEYR